MLHNYAISATAISTLVGYTSYISSNTSLTSSYLSNTSYFYTSRRINIDMTTGYKIIYIMIQHKPRQSRQFIYMVPITQHLITIQM